ncbi:winged helix-turn-helix transcriptional regulator [Metabacillus fastidiosus]|uniref:winged helix-turn-helix transcriptional regulator n=1 Tax=Metabacillus fastidiosus TaxID=1458 RepID=UPI003D2C7C2B
MENNKRDYSINYGCPVTNTLEIIGGKWKGVILYYLTSGPKRFNELRRLVPSITTRMLTLQLRELEKNGIVHREIYQQIPPKVEYSLTDFGLTLNPIIFSLRDWGELYKNEIMNVKNVEDVEFITKK